jgi:hypothetical protein
MLLEQIQPRDAARVVDDASPRAVLVFGSLPGAGRDLDLLVRDEDLDAIRSGLDREGFRSQGDEWVRFAAGSAEAVDLLPASSWRLPSRSSTSCSPPRCRSRASPASCARRPATRC